MRHLFYGALYLAIAGTTLAQQPTEVTTSGGAVELAFPIYDLAAPITSAGSTAQAVDANSQALRVQQTKTGMKIELAADVLFDFDKATLRPQAQEALSQVASIVRDNAKSIVRIDGHTDSKGTATHNQTLSIQRARAVKDWLQTREKLSGVQFKTQGFGATRPVAPNTMTNGSDDPDGRQKNRRVEIVIERT